MERNAPTHEVDVAAPQNALPIPEQPSPSHEFGSAELPTSVLKRMDVGTGNDRSSLFGQFANNPFFTAGFGLAGLGVIAAAGRSSLRHGAALLKRRMLVNVEITGRDTAYQWLLQWMSAYQRSQLRSAVSSGTNAGEQRLWDRFLRRVTPNLHDLQIQTSIANRADGSPQTHFSLVPGPGRHIFRYRNAFIAVSRQREKSFDRDGIPFETVTLTTLFSQRHVFEDLFAEAHQMAQQMKEGKTVLYTSHMAEWRPFGQPKRKRPIDSVVLEKGLKERMIDDIKAFLSARTWYLDRGIPYRRGYLLYGPPGTGKSSFIQALAGELDFNIGILNLSERGLTDDRLNHLLTNIPPRTIVLLEDADAAFTNRAKAQEDGFKSMSVTFSGLLNALDGVASAEERVIFLTTNHVSRLDSALIRPGRVDMAVRLGEADAYQIEQLWDRFYGEFDDGTQGKHRFMEKMYRLGLIGQTSAAQLQGLFLYNRGDMEGAIDMVDQLKEPPPTNTD
ncbi:MAG: hypothetical protein M1821_009332 [Bathelium mastoideum]|nr:MAG: hypothetical protein M1821_009332 [Bathelium mastoideum]